MIGYQCLCRHWLVRYTVDDNIEEIGQCCRSGLGPTKPQIVTDVATLFAPCLAQPTKLKANKMIIQFNNYRKHPSSAGVQSHNNALQRTCVSFQVPCCYNCASISNEHNTSWAMRWQDVPRTQPGPSWSQPISTAAVQVPNLVSFC